MAPQLQDFPDELLVDILGYLPKSDLKSARLTCARYGHIGAQWLFQRVYFAPRKAVIDTFLNISANPIFARTVTELVYDGRLYLVDLTNYKGYRRAYDAYWEYCKQKEKARGTVEKWTRKEIKDEMFANSIVRYARAYDQQERILGDTEDYKALLIGLKKFLNITTVIALDNFSQDGDWVPSRKDDHTWYDQRFGCEFLMTLAPSSWAQMNEDGFHKCDVRGIHNLIRAVSKQCQNLKEVQLALASKTSSAPMTIFDAKVYNEACTMAQRLKSLKVNLHQSAGDSLKDLPAQYFYLGSFLSQARELRSLAIGGPVIFSASLKTVWPLLETLHLRDFYLNVESFKPIIQAHRRTVRELTLRNAIIFGDDGWADVAKEMGKYLRLRRVSVSGLSDSVRRGDGTDYLDDETNLAVARSFMQSIPQTTLLDGYPCTIIGCPEEGEVGDSNGS